MFRLTVICSVTCHRLVLCFFQCLSTSLRLRESNVFHVFCCVGRVPGVRKLEVCLCPTCFRGSKKKRVVMFYLCFETLASWQHGIDCNTTSAGLSKLGATHAAQVSATKQGKNTCVTKAKPRFPNPAASCQKLLPRSCS